MAITKQFFNFALDFSWLGERVLNDKFEANYALNPNDAGFEHLKYYQYVPRNLDFRSDDRYLTFIEDVNWSVNGISDRIIHPDSEMPPNKDWNNIVNRSVDQQKIELAFTQWANVFNINNVAANIAFAYSDMEPGAGSGVTYVGDGNYEHQYVILFNNDLVGSQSGIETGNLSLGTSGGWVAMHELGHVFGLFHGRDDATLGANTTYDLRKSIMWYPANANTSIALTPGMDDIKKLQIKFGLSDAQDGNTSYTFGQGSVDLGHGNILDGIIGANLNKYVMTISDRAGGVGGIDTIDASSLATRTYIDLRAGNFSAIGTDVSESPTDGDDYNADGTPDGFIPDGEAKYNVGIAVGAEIENAKGGAVDDYIRGNDLRNELEGNGGNDTLQGGVGNDTLDGGSGNDTYILEGLFTMATIKDNDGQGSITLDTHAIFGASKQILKDIYHDEGPGKKTYIKLSDGGLLVAGAGGEQNIYIQQWNSNNLGLSLTGEVADAPDATPFSTFESDEKTIISHFKTSKHLPCSPISMRVAEHPLFNLNTQKPAANDNNWGLVA